MSRQECAGSTIPALKLGESLAPSSRPFWLAHVPLARDKNSVLIDSRTQELHIEDVTIYPRSGQFDPYVQQLMILILKSTQNLQGYNRV